MSLISVPFQSNFSFNNIIIIHIINIYNCVFLQTSEKYILEIEIRDMAGDPSGLFNVGRAVVSLNDINDNPPTFAQPLVS